MFSIIELIRAIIVTAAIGYIFSGYIKKPETELNVLYENKYFNWENIKFATLVAAPAVILHELAHKFVAMSFGLSAILKIYWEGLGLAIFLKLINSPFLIIAPAYVSISGNATNFQSMITSFAGPFLNLLLFLISYIVLNRAKLTRNQAIILYLTKQINMFLFIFNMLPIPPLDGSRVFYNLYKILFSGLF